MSSSTKKSWLPRVFAESTDGDDDDSLIPVHSDLLQVAINIQESNQLEGVIGKFCNIFGKESSEDFSPRYPEIRTVKRFGREGNFTPHCRNVPTKEISFSSLCRVTPRA
ncbi:hypothetical protein HNY73_000681 [Argiope bruennichi]|uniref:Uncharacterized protein n=1 Tax=Argiope bruennichi TaxID=94029 RepID=A0A8T0G1F8_ARGBR|nr:hypothetical protein HNY73_000681 [Argiope bruennichi]